MLNSPAQKLASVILASLFLVSCGKSESRIALEQELKSASVTGAQSRTWPEPTEIAEACKATALEFYGRNFAIHEPFTMNPDLAIEFAQKIAPAIEETPDVANLIDDIMFYEVKYDTTGWLEGKGYACMVLMVNDQPKILAALGVKESGEKRLAPFHTSQRLYRNFCAAGDKDIASSYLNSFKCVDG